MLKSIQYAALAFYYSNTPRMWYWTLALAFNAWHTNHPKQFEWLSGPTREALHFFVLFYLLCSVIIACTKWVFDLQDKTHHDRIQQHLNRHQKDQKNPKDQKDQKDQKNPKWHDKPMENQGHLCTSQMENQRHL